MSTKPQDNGVMVFGAWSLEHDGRCWHLTETRATSHHRSKNAESSSTTYHATIQQAFRKAGDVEIGRGTPVVGLHKLAKAIDERFTQLEEAAGWFAAKHGRGKCGEDMRTGEVVKRTRDRKPAARKRIVRKVD